MSAASEPRLLAGFDLGGTKAAVCVGQALDGGAVRVLERRAFPTGPDSEPGPVLEQCIDAVRQMAPRGVAAAGVSCGGPLSADRTRILRPPNLPRWEVDVVELLRQRLGAPAAMQNDADACALAEWQCGAGRGCRNMIFLTFGTGLGAGLILDGRLYTGACGMAGEAGHVRLAPDGPSGYGKFGSFEGFCSGGGIAQLGRQYAARARQTGAPCAFGEGASARDIAAAADAGDETALQVYRRCGEQLGRGLAVLVDILNPERIVLGSIFARSQHLLRESMQRTLAEEALPENLRCCRIVPALLGQALGDTAALCVARQAAGPISTGRESNG